MKQTAIVSIAIGAAILAGGIRSNLINEQEPPSIRAEIRGQNVLVISHPSNNIVPGRSRDDIEVANRRRDQARANRDLLARESQRGESYTGTGTPIKLYQDSTNNCVKWWKAQTGRSESLGYAGRIRVGGLEPRIGAGALEWNHISLVVAIKENSVIVHESNYVKNWVTEREIPLNKLRGFYY